MRGYDDWKTDAPDDGCSRCEGLAECICEEDRQQAIDDAADARVEDDWLRERGFDV